MSSTINYEDYPQLNEKLKRFNDELKRTNLDQMNKKDKLRSALSILTTDIEDFVKIVSEKDSKKFVNIFFKIIREEFESLVKIFATRHKKDLCL